jgi:hypothetical protein
MEKGDFELLRDAGGDPMIRTTGVAGRETREQNLKLWHTRDTLDAISEVALAEEPSYLDASTLPGPGGDRRAGSHPKAAAPESGPLPRPADPG